MLLSYSRKWQISQGLSVLILTFSHNDEETYFVLPCLHGEGDRPVQEWLAKLASSLTPIGGSSFTKVHGRMGYGGSMKKPRRIRIKIEGMPQRAREERNGSEG